MELPQKREDNDVKLRLHHVNVCSDNMEELHQFYSKVLGLETVPLPPMIEYGEWAIKGWDQIFLTGPAGNTIEIHALI